MDKKRPSSRAGLFSVCTLLLLLGPLGPAGKAQETISRSLHVVVRDSAQKPVSQATVVVKTNGIKIWSGKTDAKGEARITHLPASSVLLVVTKENYQPLPEQTISLAEQSVEMDVLLAPKRDVRETVNVQGEAGQVASSAQELQRDEIKSQPDKPATVTDAITHSPGVVRAPDGQLTMAGADEKHSALLVNSVNVTDPATGQFGLSPPVNSVDVVKVTANPFMAQYGGFTAGLVTTETRRGGEKWAFEFNDPFPEFRIRSWHMQGMRSVSPNVSFSGPLLKQKLYFAESAQYDLEKTPVRTLPFGSNETKTDARNSFTQMDLVLSQKHTLTGTFHLQTLGTQFAGLDFFNPQPVTPDLKWNAEAVTLIDRLDLGSGVLQSTFTAQDFRTRVTPQGTAEMLITPAGNQGNYFGSQTRESSRMALAETYIVQPIKLLGTHNVTLGTSAEHSDNRGQFMARNVAIEDANGNVLKQLDFVGGSHFHRSDIEVDAFAQDHWVLTPSFALDGGLRMEEQQISGTWRFAPRLGFAWTPFGKDKQTIIRGGAGIFYDHVPLNVFAFQQYPQLLDSSTAVVPNIIFMHRGRLSGKPGFAPYSVASSVEVEHAFSRMFKIEAKFRYRDSDSLIMVQPVKDVNGNDTFAVSDSGNSQYSEMELNARVGEHSKRKLFFSYVRSVSRGDLNVSSNYLGNLPSPIIRPDFFTFLPGDVPNRVLLWGETPLPWKTKITPLLEFRSGFPYSTTDARQNYIGLPNSNRFPNYFSLDTRVSKDFQITQKYATRLSLRALNLTNHFNALAVHSNTGDPLFGNFFGNNPRRFRLDFDVLF